MAKEIKAETKPVKKTEKNKNGKPGFFARLGKKFKDTFSELKKVTWPTFPKVLKSTGIVLGVVLIFMVAVTAIDSGLLELLKWLTNLGA